MRLKANSPPGLNPTTPCVDYAQLLKTLCIDTVRAAAQSLLAEICDILHANVSPTPLEKHFADPVAFETQSAIIKLPEDQYWIVTGDQTHFLMTEPTVPDCPHHDYANSYRAGVAAVPGPVLQRSVDPRSFFYSREKHHCAHQNVALAKSQPITPENRERCGPRSGRDYDAFCEIWSFERGLCCRTCVFENVCTRAQVFLLPCQRLVQVGGAGSAAPEVATG
jgi:hypothetical protein